VVRTLTNEGITSFWRGNFASVVRYFPQQALNFAFKDEIQKQFKVSKNASKKERFSKNILSGGCAGSLSLLFVQSIDYTRTRLAVDTRNAKTGGRRQFSGIVDVYRKTIKADGVRGLYRGFGIYYQGRWGQGALQRLWNLLLLYLHIQRTLLWPF